MSKKRNDFLAAGRKIATSRRQKQVRSGRKTASPSANGSPRASRNLRPLCPASLASPALAWASELPSEPSPSFGDRRPLLTRALFSRCTCRFAPVCAPRAFLFSPAKEAGPRHTQPSRRRTPPEQACAGNKESYQWGWSFRGFRRGASYADLLFGSIRSDKTKRDGCAKIARAPERQRTSLHGSRSTMEVHVDDTSPQLSPCSRFNLA